jgi:hypothetical protein
MALDVPAVLFGVPAKTLLAVYQSRTIIYSQLTPDAPPVWQFFRGDRGETCQSIRAAGPSA